MLPITADTLRVFVHVVAAAVWVGGQITLAGLVPALRDLGPDAPRTVARRFNRIAWPAFTVVVATGVWNVVEVDPDWDDELGVTVLVKVGVVAASGISAAVHASARSELALAAFGALSSLTALAAVLLGVQLG